MGPHRRLVSVPLSLTFQRQVNWEEEVGGDPMPELPGSEIRYGPSLTSVSGKILRAARNRASPRLIKNTMADCFSLPDRPDSAWNVAAGSLLSGRQVSLVLPGSPARPHRQPPLLYKKSPAEKVAGPFHILFLRQ